MYWVANTRTIPHYSAMCKYCLEQKKPEIYKPCTAERKVRGKDRQYFKCSKCGNKSYRDKKKEYSIRQLGCSKCGGFKTLEKIRKPIKKIRKPKK